MKIKHTENYSLLRKKDYPPIEDQIEAIWALFPEKIRDANPVFKKIMETKTKYPKVPNA